MKKCTDIYSVEFYLPKAKSPKKRSGSNNNNWQKAPKVLVQDDIKNSMYLVDA